MRSTLCIALALATASANAADPKPAHAPNPVLVELFTSEGCSSCPPADALLSRLQHEQPIAAAQIIVLGEHVDYWDGLGWRDRFASRQFTARQNDYGTRFQLDSVYTPQMVVDGTAQFVGNDQTAAWRAIATASRSAKLPLTLSNAKIDGRHITASVAAAGSIPPGDVFAALVDLMDTTEVRRGENSGRKLQHVAVVRTLMRIGSTHDLAGGPLSFTLTTPEAEHPAPMQLVVFAQQAHSGMVLGVTMSETLPVATVQAGNLLVGQAGLPHLQ